ncbi:MAG: hemerythrin domain-containing protein [Dehalococcoidia bacterium]|nr:hemerythrin domain-containing protein [Dehalococcoidia bacterium]
MATFGNLETEVEPLASLMREHTEVHDLVTEVREVLEQALAEPGEAGLATAALEKLRDLDAYLAEDLVIHIAKEEEVLFPALRGFAADIDQVVDEMVEQHDEIRHRQEIIERALAAMDHTHDEVDAERTSLAAGIRAAEANGLTPETLAELLDGVKRLDWILQGHFGDEEDDLFVPALELLSEETFAELAKQAAALDV